jgi:hypothetical protein
MKMKVKLFVIAVVVLLSGCFSSTQAQKPCGCEEKAELLNQLNLTQIALQEAQFQMNLILALESKSGKPVMATDEGVNLFQENIQGAQSGVSQWANPGYSMNVVDCTVTVQRENTNSDCVELIRKQFYDFVQKACLATKSSRSSDQPYYGLMELKSYLLHIMQAYSEKQRFILQILGSLPKNCRPNNWFGYVVYQKVQTYTNDDVRTDKALQSSKKVVYTGTVFVEEGKAVRAGADGTYHSNIFNGSSGRISCSGRQETISRQDVMKDVAKGKADGNPTHAFSFIAYPDSYDLSVRFLIVKTTGQRTTSSKVTATSCTEGHEKTESEPFTYEIPASGHGVMNEKINRASPDYLEGSRVERPIDTSDKGLFGLNTRTEEIKLRWMLRRLPQK